MPYHGKEDDTDNSTSSNPQFLTDPIYLQLVSADQGGFVHVRRVLALLIAFFTFTMLFLFLVIKDKVSAGRIPVCEWGAVICSELFIGTFYFDLGDDYYIEQVKVDMWSRKHGYKKLSNEEDEA